MTKAIMSNSSKKWIAFSFGILLAVTGFAKIISYFGNERILYLDDPLYGFPFRNLLLLAGVLEAFLAGICFFSKNAITAHLIVAFLATNFFVYRVALWCIGWHRPCNCLGNLTGALHISSHTADTIMKIVLAYLLIGSYGSLFWLWRQKRNAVQRQECRPTVIRPNS